MSLPTPEVKSSTRARALVILGALASGAVAAVSNGTVSEVTMWGADEPGPNVRCTVAHVRAERAAIDLFGLDAGDAPYAYGIARTCATPGDAGDVPPLPHGITVLEEIDEEVEYDGGATMTVWLGSAAPWTCACAPTGSGCEAASALEDGGVEWGPAPQDTTLGPDMWRGAGCVRKPCVEVSGYPSMPVECQ